MPSLNKIMNMWHAYKGANSKRKNLGYYATKEDALEAEARGERTDKAHNSNKRAEKKAATTVRNLAARVSQEGQS